ncbi:MAG: serine/threonine protein kinase, partial [Deltaproteobacteria bacterium]|nr:serine/threonine protein kinase [Deltaproteobacteria bacterium]
MKYGRYEIIKELGRGAMGVVYQAHDPRIDRLVALKVLRPDRVTSQDFVQRFLKEAKAIGRLSHANIVTVYDVGQDHETIYIAMEFLEGRPLNEVVREKPPAVKDVINIGLQVAEALNYAHARGIIHRDIKPSNIILDDEGRIKITDFGIARIEDPEATQQTQAGEILGTPVYMSPEQVMGKTVDGRSDLYSLGIILYELTTGQRPFSGENIAVIFRAITQDIPSVPQTADGNLPPAF